MLVDPISWRSSYVAVALLLFARAGLAQESSVLVTGLSLPYKLVMTSVGNLLVSEGGDAPNNGRISLVTKGGVRTSLIDGMPSGLAYPELTPIGPTGLALSRRTLYIAIGEGDSIRAGAAPNSIALNPAGVSSPLFHSVLRVDFDADVDLIREPFTLAKDQHQSIFDGNSVSLKNATGQTARIEMFLSFPPVTPDAASTYRHSDPFALALEPGEGPAWLYVVDAGQNTVLRVSTNFPRFKVLARFSPTPNGTPVGPPVVDAVPTGVVVVGNQVLVSMLSGFPFTPGQGRVMAVDLPSGSIDPWINLLTSTTDIAVRRSASPSQFFVVGFSDNQMATPPAPGRLTMYSSPVGQVISNTLVTPTGVAVDPGSMFVYVAEFAAGRITRFTIP